MYGGNRDQERSKQKIKRNGFRQTHGGREQFSGGEWGTSSEFSRNSVYHESDSYNPDKDRHYSPRRYSIDGVDFDPDERDDESYDREHNRSRFAQPYTGGQITRKGNIPQEQDHSGKGPIGYRRSDEKIYEDVCEALFENPSVDATDIDVSVSDGLVTLSGTVDTRYEKREAENSIENLSGVIDVHNDLRLKEIPKKEYSQEQ